MTVLRVALAQLNPTVGDIDGNLAKLLDAYDRADAAGCDVIAFPELSITGYPPEDLLLKEHFLRDAWSAVERLAAEAEGIVAVVGAPERTQDVFNAAVVLADGAVQGTYRKVHLPNYGVFDEIRYFQSGTEGALIEVDGVKVGLPVCEDVWVPGSPLAEAALAGEHLVVHISASPYDRGEGQRRGPTIVQRARDNGCEVAF